jgi:hypothetical protein
MGIKNLLVSNCLCYKNVLLPEQIGIHISGVFTKHIIQGPWSKAQKLQQNYFITYTHKELLIKRLKRKECLTLTLSTTITSIEPLRIKVSTRLSACSPQSGCERSKFWVFTPIDSASDLSSACSASIKAQ